MEDQIAIIKNSGLFDEEWYLRQYPDVAAADMDPIDHYLKYGVILGRNPSPHFNTLGYWEANEDVARLGLNPLVHYIQYGKKENRKLLPRYTRYDTLETTDQEQIFDQKYYLEQNPDVRFSGMDPFVHYLKFGKKEGRLAAPMSAQALGPATFPNLFEIGPGTNVGNVSAALERMKKNPRPPAIIIPVFNAPQEVKECLESVIKNTYENCRIIVIDDASTDPRIKDVLNNFKEVNSVELFENKKNLGYTRTINRGLEMAELADVVFLNSDTRVTPGWLRNLRLAAYSDQKVGTATPFSNNAGSFSVPEIDRENPLPDCLSLDDYARAISQVSHRSYPVVPTGNGFCMYVRRDCLDETKALDVEAFPRGYGEENDFCMRAGRLGWKHVIDDATFIYHVRSASFNDEKTGLMEAGRKIIEKRYPEYKAKVQEAFSAEALKSAQDRVRKILDFTQTQSLSVKKRILFVLTLEDGGTPRTNQDLMNVMADKAETFVLRCDSQVLTLVSYADGSYFEVEKHKLEEPIKAFPHRSQEYDRVVAEWLVRYSFEIVHIRHMALQSLGLIDVAKEIQIPVIFSFHDFYALCPNIKLLDNFNHYCEGACTRGPGDCQHELWLDLDFPPLKNAAITDWRTQMEGALEKCDAFITASKSAKDILLKSFPKLASKLFPVVPHGRDFPEFYKLAAPIKAGEKIRLLAPGNINLSKGGEILKELGRLARSAGLEIHIIGAKALELDFGPDIVCHGPYFRENFAEKVKKIRPHLGGIFSIWPETYCHTLTELWSCGIPVIAFDFGALGERLRESGAGWLLDKPTAEAVLDLIERIGKDPLLQKKAIDQVLLWQKGPGIEFSCEKMGLAYWDIYERLLDRHGRDGVLPGKPDRSSEDQQNPRAVSIIVLNLDGALHLDRLLQTFLNANTHDPVEIIVIDHGSTDNTPQVLSKYSARCSIRHIKRGANFSFSSSCNLGAKKAKYPLLLFLNNDIIFTSDVLPPAVSKLSDPSIGAVGVRLDDDPKALAPGQEPRVQHTGIRFVWNEKRGYYHPEQIRHASVKEYSAEREPQAIYEAITGAFMLCRKSDFERLGGFSTDYNYGLEDIDFCLRLGRDLKKKCWCLNQMSLQHIEAATRKLGNQKDRSELIEQNHRIFKIKWDSHIQRLLNKFVDQPAKAKTKKQPMDRTLTTETPKRSQAPQRVIPDKIRGAIKEHMHADTLVRGWLAYDGDPSSREGIIKVDNRHEFEVQCHLLDKDLIKNGQNSGWHGFEWIVPLHLVDGKSHNIQLMDKDTRKVVAAGEVIWSMQREFKDLSGFLAHSYNSPLIAAPFREEDKRCFATMENIANYLASSIQGRTGLPKVSVIMPVFNRESTVKIAVESALGQIYENLQLIVVDDGSTDGTAKVLAEINDPRMKVLRQPKNKGQCAALNLAIDQALGDYIAYLDSDNTWDPRYLAAMIGAFLSLPDADALYGGQLLFNGWTDTPFGVRFGTFNKSLLVNRNYIDRNAFMHKKEVHKKLGGYDESIKRYVDWDFIIRTSETHIMYSIPILLSNYYYDLVSNTMTNDQRHIENLGIIRKNQKKRTQQKQIDTGKKLTLSRKISIIIPSYEALDEIKACIESILDSGLGEMAEIIVVDNASNQKVIDYLSDLAARDVITLILNKVNYGFSHAVNQGFASSWPGRDVIILNNDAYFTRGAIAVMQKAAYELADCAVVVPQQVLPGGTKTITTHVPYANPSFDCDVNISAHHNNIAFMPLFHNARVLEVTYAPFFCVYIKREVLDHTQGLDAEHGRHYRSDRVFCDYVRHVMKMKIYHVSDAVVYHLLQKSTEDLRSNPKHKKDYDVIFRKNKWEPELARQLGYFTPVWDR